MNYHLAPMMGYTDCYFRLLAEKLYKNHITTFSEMIVDKAIIHNETKTIDKHFLANNISSIQIAGSEPIEIKLAIQKLNKIDRINHINLNLGCPSSRGAREQTRACFNTISNSCKRMFTFFKNI